MAGMTTSQANTPPEKITPAMRGPIMYPTPRYSVVVLARNEPPGSHFGLYVGVLGQTENMFSFWKNVYSAPSPSPANTRLAKEPPLSPAISTSAQAVPSGYKRLPCSFTINWQSRGIMKHTPKHPTTKATKGVHQESSPKPRKIKSSKVKTTPPA